MLFWALRMVTISLLLLAHALPATALLSASGHLGRTCGVPACVRSPPPAAVEVDLADLNSLKGTAAAIQGRVTQALEMIDVPRQQLLADELEAQASKPGFWDAAAAAEGVLRRLNEAKGVLLQAEQWQASVGDVEAALQLAAEMGDDADEEAALRAEACAALQTLESELSRWELQALMGGEHDARGAVLTLTVGAGGVDAQDWTSILLRMYERWANAQPGYRVKLSECTAGDEAGLKSASLTIDGPYAYGLLRSERGTHRLVRLSPFNADNKRQTSFAGVELMPILDEAALVAIEIPPSDLEVSTTQHNTTQHNTTQHNITQHNTT